MIFFLGFVFSTIGVSYFIYGKKEGDIMPMLSGAILFIIPYIISNISWLLGVGFLCLILPFIIKI